MLGLSAAYAPRGILHLGEFDWIYDVDNKMREAVRQRWLDNDPTTIVQKYLHAFTASKTVYLDGAAQDEFHQQRRAECA